MVTDVFLQIALLPKKEIGATCDANKILRQSSIQFLMFETVCQITYNVDALTIEISSRA